MAQIRPTFSESWYRVADLRAKLRASAQISRQYYRGERWYVVRDPAGNQFHRLSAPAYRFVGLLDGTRSVAEAWELVGGQLADDAPTQNEVIQILSQLHSANLLEADVTPDAAVLLRRHKKMVKRQWQGRLMNLLFPRIPLWDPDRFLCRWMPLVKPFLSKFGALLWLAVVISAIVALIPEWPRLQTAAKDAINPNNWLFLWATFVVIKAIHELGHGFACRGFGGEVHEMGIMFLVLVPAPYVDASTAWAFPSKWARIFVGVGGMIIELFVAAIMAFIWLNTAPGHPANQLAYNAMLIASVSTILFNANPLLRFDGYYILSDWLEIPNLRMRATEYTLGLIKRHLFKVKMHQPLPPIKQRFWLFTFCITSSIYRILIGVAIILMVWNEVPVLGTLMAIGGVVTWLVMPLLKSVKYLTIDPELHRKRGRAGLWVGGFLTAAVILIGFVPFDVNFETTGIVEPEQKMVLHTRVAGTIEEIVAAHGTWLRAGDVIFIARDRQLEIQVAQEEARLNAREKQLQQVIARNLEARTSAEKNPAEARVLQKEIEVIRKSLAEARQRQKDLVIRSPIDGLLIAPELHQMRGRYVQRGTEVATVATLDKLRIAASIDQSDAALAYLHRGTEVQVRLAGVKSGNLFRSVDIDGEVESRNPVPQYRLPSAALGYAGGGDAATDPADEDGLRLLRPQIELWIRLNNAGLSYVPGQRAYLRFTLDEQPLFYQWKRKIWQVIQSRSNSKWT